MIKVEHLKSGNILQFFIGEEGCEWEYTKIDWQDIKWCQEKNANFNKFHKGIEITKDLLKQTDFQLQSECFCFWQNSAWGIEKTTKGEWAITYMGEFSGKFVKYFHQLQNFYFELSGSMLELLPVAHHSIYR